MWNLVMASQISTFYSYSFIRMPFFLLLYTGRDWRFKKVLQSKGAVTWYNVNPNSQPIGIGHSFPNHVSCCCIKQSLRFYLIYKRLHSYSLNSWFNIYSFFIAEWWCVLMRTLNLQIIFDSPFLACINYRIW